MTTKNSPYTKVEQAVWDALLYSDKAREVGKNLTVDGYKKLREDGFPDNPELIKKHVYSEWNNEHEAIKAFAVSLGMSETFINGIWSEMKEDGKLRVGNLEDGRVVTYESPG
jgi:hypothetical protein